MTLESHMYWSMVILIGCNIMVCLAATWRARQKRKTWTVEDTLFCISLIFTGAAMAFFPSFEAWVEGVGTHDESESDL